MVDLLRPRCSLRSAGHFPAPTIPHGSAARHTTSFHIPMVAGIIAVAVADHVVIAHSTEHLSAPAVLTIVVGPALFLAGDLFFKRALFGSVSRPRAGALAVLVRIPLPRRSSGSRLWSSSGLPRPSYSSSRRPTPSKDCRVMSD